MDNHAVQVRNLHKSYAGRTVVDHVSFDIARGEIVALLGPNGAGKSTTVEILEGHRRRTGGDAAVLGLDPGDHARALRARIGIVLQDTGRPRPITVREQLREFAALYPQPYDVDDLIAAVGLTAQASMRLAKLSGGQRRRVDVALGLVGRPELLFLDEPTTGFDPQVRRGFWALVHELRERGTTILLTTHDLDEAAHLADRVIVLAHGRVRATGPVSALRSTLLPAVRWTEDGMPRAERTQHPFAFAAALADRLGCSPDEFELERPTLEDAYLALVGDREEVA